MDALKQILKAQMAQIEIQLIEGMQAKEMQAEEMQEEIQLMLVVVQVEDLLPRMEEITMEEIQLLRIQELNAYPTKVKAQGEEIHQMELGEGNTMHREDLKHLLVTKVPLGLKDVEINFFE